MNYTWTQDTNTPVPGVTQVLVCDGEMFGLEIQEHDNDAVIGTVWRVISATFWEPADVDCILEQEYESLGAAKLALETYDREAVEDELRMEIWINS